MSTADSSGRGLTEIYDLVLPVLLVGHEESDGTRLLLGGVTVLSLAPAFAWAAVFSDESDLWLEQARADNVTVSAVVIGVTPTVDLPLAAVAPLATAVWVEPPQSARVLTSPAGGSPALPASTNVSVLEPWSFERPGYLLRQGRAMVFGGQLAGTDFHAMWACREG